MITSTRIALVTGANKGIGFEIARQLAMRGFLVFLAGRQHDALAQAAAALEKEGGAVRVLDLDVTDPNSINLAAGIFSQAADHLDVLVNNAGIFQDKDKNIITLETEVFRHTLETNVLGPIHVTQAFYPALAKSQNGRVINMSSGMGALHDMEGTAPAYSISKTALNAVTRQLASVLGAHAIAVNAVCPGWVKTDMGGQGAPRTVEQGADTPVWLATEAPQSLTGKFLRDRQEISW